MRWLCVAALVVLIGCDAMPGSFREAVQGVDAMAPPAVQPEQGQVFDPDDPGGAGAPGDGSVPKPDPEPEAADPAPAEDTKPEPEPAAPKPNKPDANAEARAKCVKGRGNFTKTAAGLFVCVNRTRDATKSCSSSSQCEGACLARSGTCSPVTPLIGCHDVVTDNGSMATVCID